MLKKGLLGTVLIFSLLSAEPSLANYSKANQLVKERNYGEAVEVLKTSVDTDDKSQYLLAFLYYHGFGVPQDYQKALELFQKSMKANNVNAQTYLGYMYSEGKGVKQDKQKALELYAQSKEQGDVSATLNMAVMYYTGDGVDKDYDRAFELLETVKDARNPQVQLYLGHMYFNGQGVDRDKKKAWTYYVRAAQLSNVDAHLFLGHMYQKGDGITANNQKAKAYYEYAAYRDNPEAQYNLATMYLSSKATGQTDKVSAYVWLDSALNNGFDKAKEALSTLKETMSYSSILQAKENITNLKKQAETRVKEKSPALKENLGKETFVAHSTTSASQNQGQEANSKATSGKRRRQFLRRK